MVPSVCSKNKTLEPHAVVTKPSKRGLRKHFKKQLLKLVLFLLVLMLAMNPSNYTRKDYITNQVRIKKYYEQIDF